MSSQSQPTTTKIVNFNYQDLNSQQRSEIERATAAIRERLRKAAQDIWEIGRMLSEVQSQLQRGQFDDWIKSEFDWSRRTAYKFISVYKRFDHSINLEEVNIATSALYLLAAESTPEEVREEFIQKAQEGEKVTHQQVLRVVKKAKAESTENPQESSQVDNQESEPQSQKAIALTDSLEKPLTVSTLDTNPTTQPKLIIESGWYQLPSSHHLFCGDTALPEFTNCTPYSTLAIAITTDDWAHDWLIEKAKTVVVFPESEYDRQKLTGLIVMFSAAEDKIILPWLPHPEMIAIAYQLGRQVYAGDVDIAKCQAAVDFLGNK
ncbi:MAG: DUF3102 domain-containing protein [Cyanobacteria bacterium P01_C01_bin.72]